MTKQERAQALAEATGGELLTALKSKVFALAIYAFDPGAEPSESDPGHEPITIVERHGLLDLCVGGVERLQQLLKRQQMMECQNAVRATLEKGADDGGTQIVT